MMRVEESFQVGSDAETLFDYLTDPERLPEWQTTKVSVEQITPGEIGQGTRLRERTKGPRGEFDQITEFSRFDRPRELHVTIVEGPYPVNGTWTLRPEGGGTRVDFVAEGEVSGIARVAQPVLARLIARQFRDYHRRLKHNVEDLAASG